MGEGVGRVGYGTKKCMKASLCLGLLARTSADTGRQGKAETPCRATQVTAVPLCHLYAMEWNALPCIAINGVDELYGSIFR